MPEGADAPCMSEGADAPFTMGSATNPAAPAILEVEGVSKRFGGIQAVSDVSFRLEAGEALGLVGPNGAGKTTLFNCVCGQICQDGGAVRFDGRRIDGLDTYVRARLGIGRTFQRVEVFPELTVREHLLVAARAHSARGSLWRDLANMGQPTVDERARVDAVLALVGLREVAEVSAAALGLGTCRLVELARALVAEPRLLMADEPSSGLDAIETAGLAEVLRTVQRERGMSVLLVEHDLSMVRRMVDRVVVMDAGNLVSQGSFEEVMADPAVREAYLGGAFSARRERAHPAVSGRAGGEGGRAGGEGGRAGGEPGPVLRFENVDAAYGPYRALFGVTFDVPAGGAVALVGSNGSGKSTVARVATGLVRASAGRVLFGGRDVTRTSAWRIARMGCAHVPEGTGVFASLTVEENLVLTFGQRVGSRKVAAALEEVYGAFPLLASRRRQLAGTLSGGQQRILSLAKALVEPPELLVADELSLGLAPAVVDSVYEALATVGAAGTALLVVEQLAERVFEIASEAVVLDKGAVAYKGPASGAGEALERVLGARAGAGAGAQGGEGR